MGNYNDFSFNNVDWQVLKPKPNGRIANKIWIEPKSDIAVRALFKPGRLDTCQREYDFSKIAKQLDIPCARIEVIEYEGQTGVLSFNVKSEQYLYYSAAKFASDPWWDVPVDISMYVEGVSISGIIQKYPQLEKSIVNMMFLDCLTENQSSNYNREIKCDKNDVPVDLCPLYTFQT